MNREMCTDLVKEIQTIFVLFAQNFATLARLSRLGYHELPTFILQYFLMA